jgi:hypothetical protein
MVTLQTLVHLNKDVSFSLLVKFTMMPTYFETLFMTYDNVTFYQNQLSGFRIMRQQSIEHSFNYFKIRHTGLIKVLTTECVFRYHL